MTSENQNIFSLARFRTETQGFTSLPTPRRRGMLISYTEFLAYVLFLRTPWRRLFRRRLSDPADQTDALLYLAPPLRDEHVCNSRVFADRNSMLLSFDKNRRWAEVGTFEGKFAREIVDRCQPSELHVIDISLDSAKNQGYISENRDADQAIKKLKPDGTLIFNDYLLISHLELSVYGIIPMVNSLCHDEGFEMTAFAMHYKMYCDVALRRRLAQSTADGGTFRAAGVL